ncbi:MAG: hypothetical protein NT011_01785 [Kiritimatiellaeota bacterium]|nr:hypothetical protein [Kiritimatiellota bacterium]
MFNVEFHIVHRGCLVNELSRSFPKIRFICPGGFVLGPSSVEELIVLDKPSEAEVQAVLNYLGTSPKVATVELLERSSNRAFVRMVSTALPQKFCSQVVAKHHCFPIGTEIQEGGLEMWRVGCVERRQAEQLLEELEGLGELKHSSISEGSWQALLEGET